MADVQTVPSSSQDSMVTCITKDEKRVQVPFKILSVCKTFKEMCENCGIENQMDGEFPVRVIGEKLFHKVIEFCEKTKGNLILFKNQYFVDEPEPEIKEDPDTKERIWFTFSDYEKTFFSKLSIPELAEILNAASFLNIRRLFLYGCQEAARLMEGKTPAQIRADWEFVDDLTEEEIKQIKEENIWCNC